MRSESLQVDLTKVVRNIDFLFVICVFCNPVVRFHSRPRMGRSVSVSTEDMFPLNFESFLRPD